MDEVALVGGVLYDAPDPLAASEVLASLLMEPSLSTERIRMCGFEPALVRSAQRALPRDPAAIRLACARGGAWVLGRRSDPHEEGWELVASRPHDLDLPAGIRRTTAETIIGLISEAAHSLRFAAPYIDPAGISIFNDAIAAATTRDVDVEVFQPPHWPPSIEALEVLREHVILTCVLVL